MHLVVDCGNTAFKFAVFDKDELVYNQVATSNYEAELTQVLEKFTIHKSILSSVVHHPQSFETALAEKTHCFRFDHQTPLPFEMHYTTPETLGLDRIANVAGLYAQYGAQNALAVDIGTCIKFDLLNHQGYQGGSIAPGIQMRFKALHTFTDKLPLIEQEKYTHLTGQSTKESILSGVLVGAAHEINGMITSYAQQYPSLQTIITGGDAKPLEDILSLGKNSIFADAFLTLRGLNYILHHND